MSTAREAVCRLCQLPAKLQSSHVLPEFFYTAAYDSVHRFDIVHRDTNQIIRTEQLGIREKLLCNQCEKHFSPWEDYAKRILFDSDKITERKATHLDQVVDYKRFKLFLMSLLWRCSVSSTDFFPKVNLGHHEETLRAMLLSGNAGEANEYPCLLEALRHNGEPLLDMVWGLSPAKCHGVHFYRLIAGGFFMGFVVANHTPIELQPVSYLQKDGLLIIPIREAATLPFSDGDEFRTMLSNRFESRVRIISVRFRFWRSGSEGWNDWLK